jgi:S-formylglutathione hydrolase FrmB
VTPAAHPEGRRPLLVFLHGRNGDERSELDDAFFSALAELGSRAPIVAFPYGGDDSYWHDRADGRWGAYVTREVIPQVVKQFGADRRRVAIGGISMGGFGAYDIARLHPGRFCAVAGHSPALWRTGGETAPGAFDDAEDFARHDVIASAQANPDAFGRTRVWLDAGDEDPFRPGDEALTRALRGRVTTHTWPGGHDGDYWNAHWPDYARFYARALASC